MASVSGPGCPLTTTIAAITATMTGIAITHCGTGAPLTREFLRLMTSSTATPYADHVHIQIYKYADG